MRQADILRLLPAVFQRSAEHDGPLPALLCLMEALHRRPEQAIEDLNVSLDPRRTDDAFVYFLARWVDLDRLFEAGRAGAAGEDLPISLSFGRLRELVASAAFLSGWRGTRKGLIQFLETATGMSGFEVEEQPPDASGRPRPFHIRVRAPVEALAHRVIIERIIAMEKPAYVTTEPVIFENRHHS